MNGLWNSEIHKISISSTFEFIGEHSSISNEGVLLFLSTYFGLLNDNSRFRSDA